MPVLRSIRLDHLIIGSLYYWLGAGISRYLGGRLDWSVLLLGWLLVLTIHSASCFLNDFFGKGERNTGEEVLLPDKIRFRSRLLQATLIQFTISCALLFILIFGNDLRLPASVIIVLLVCGLTLNSLPPVRLIDRGYGELLVAFYLATLTPAFSFLLQSDVLHKLNLAFALPLTLQAIAWQLAICFPSYAKDLKLERSSLLMKTTWQNGVTLHHGLIVISFFIFGALPMTGLSWRLIWPVFLAMPFMGLEIYWLQRIASGKEPVWKFFSLLAPAAHGLSIYLIVLSLWMR